MSTSPKTCDPELWTLHGKQYDFSEFVSRHPGGKDAILLGKGCDCTELFESYHILTDSQNSILGKYHRNDEGPESPFDWENTPFYDDCKVALRAHFKGKSNKASWSALLQHAFWLFTCLVSLSFWLKGSWIAMVVMPILYWVSASEMLHNATHFAMSRYPIINILSARPGMFHVNLHMWFIQHVLGHHCFTNFPALDPDVNHFTHLTDGAPGHRLHPDQNFLPKYQWWKFSVFYHSLATTMAVSFFLLPKFFEEMKISGATPIPQYMVFPVVCERCFMGVLVLLAIYKISLWKGLAFVVLSWFIHGALFFTFSQISHCNEESLNRTYTKMEWAKWQVLSALDYEPHSRFWAWASVGLNNQIVHHLFPGFHPCHYHTLRSIVLPIAKKHGIDYEGRSSNNFGDMLVKYFQWVSAVNSSDIKAKNK